MTKIKKKTNIKVDSTVKNFSAGTVLMYEEIDKDLEISKFLKKAKLKIKGVPIEDCVKFLVCGVLELKRSIREIYQSKDTLGKYIQKKLPESNLKLLYRTLETLGSHGEEIYSQINSKFEKKYNISILQCNIDYTSTFFEGTKVKLAKHGYSRNIKVGKKQIVIGFAQINDLMHPSKYFISAGNSADISQIKIDFKKHCLKSTKGTLNVFDRGMNHEDNKNIIYDANQDYLMCASTRKKHKQILENYFHSDGNGRNKNLKKFDSDKRYIKFTRNFKDLNENEKKENIFIIHSKILEKKHLKKIEKRFKKNFEKVSSIKKLTKSLGETETEILSIKIVKQQKLKKQSFEELLQKELEIKGEYAGFMILETSKLSLKIGQVLEIYKKRNYVEMSIRNVKSNCQLRPINVRNENSVKGATFISMLASLVVGVFEYKNRKFLKNTSMRSILEIIKCLTFDIYLNKFKNISKVILKNLDKFTSKLFTILPS